MVDKINPSDHITGISFKTPHEKLIMFCLEYKSGDDRSCRVTHADINDMTEISLPTISKTTRKLEKDGWIKIDAANNTTTKRYTILR